MYFHAILALFVRCLDGAAQRPLFRGDDHCRDIGNQIAEWTDSESRSTMRRTSAVCKTVADMADAEHLANIARDYRELIDLSKDRGPLKSISAAYILDHFQVINIDQKDTSTHSLDHTEEDPQARHRLKRVTAETFFTNLMLNLRGLSSLFDRRPSSEVDIFYEQGRRPDTEIEGGQSIRVIEQRPSPLRRGSIRMDGRIVTFLSVNVKRTRVDGQSDGILVFFFRNGRFLKKLHHILLSSSERNQFRHLECVNSQNRGRSSEISERKWFETLMSLIQKEEIQFTFVPGMPVMTMVKRNVMGEEAGCEAGCAGVCAVM